MNTPLPHNAPIKNANFVLKSYITFKLPGVQKKTVYHAYTRSPAEGYRRIFGFGARNKLYERKLNQIEADYVLSNFEKVMDDKDGSVFKPKK